MSNIYGRQVVLPLTNKRGSGVIAGDLVYIDTANNDAFTVGTTGGYTGAMGIAQETIANNAVGRVLIAGYAALVNVNASVTRGHYGLSHTVAAQATDGGASRVVGAFCQFLTGGTTPDALLWGFPDASSATGNVATDAIWDAAGDLVQGTGANTAAKLTLGATGTVVRSTGSTNAYAYPPGYELDYAEITSPVTVSSTTEGSETTVIDGNSVTFENVPYLIEFFSNSVAMTPGAAGRSLVIVMYEDSTSLGRVCTFTPIFVSTQSAGQAVYIAKRRTPAAGAHTYHIKAWKSNAGDTGVIGAGDGAATHNAPAFMRITKV